MDNWITGLMDYWIDGFLDRWIDGLMDRWIVGAVAIPSLQQSKNATFDGAIK
jgi:hypothetical protein